MMQFLWLARLRDQWLGKVAKASRKRSRPALRRRLHHHLELERLENRIVPNVTLLNSFQGNDLDSSSGGFVPPDTMGAAGPNSYAQTVNATVSMYNKTTGATIDTDSLQDFLFTQGGLGHIASSDELGDAFSTYDSLAGRFVVGDIDVQTTSGLGPANADLFAVSKTNNPLTLTKADWFFYEINTTEPGVELQDYPGNLGYNDGALVITQNYFGSGASHVLVNSFNINALSSGATMTLGTNYFQNDFSGFSLRPTTMQDSSSPNDPMWFVEEGGDDASINVVKMTGVLSSTPTFTTTNLPVTPYFTAVDALNPDGSAINGNTDSRIMNASMENGMIVAAHQVSDAAGDLDQVQWYEINTNGVSPVLQQQGDVSGGVGTYYTYPGIAINSQGMIGMSYIASGTASPTDFMSTYVTGWNPSDNPGQMETPVPVILGTVPDNDGRQGDMSAINVDSDGSFWVGNEFSTFNPGFGADSWSTAIGHFIVSQTVSTKASNASAVFSTNSQTVKLNATVTNLDNPSSKVNEGFVTFTIKNGGTIIGTAQGNVLNGTAKANLNLPGGVNVGTYTIAVSYTDGSGNFFDVSDTSGTLTITPASVTTKANNFSGSYSPNIQTLALTAKLSDVSFPGDQVSEGVVVFTITDSKNKAVGKVQGSVSGGVATANFNLPAGQSIGTYTIAVSYVDPGTGNFIELSNTPGTLTISQANIVTTASNITTAYSPNAQIVKLIATVADASVPTDIVGEGMVTFTVTDSESNLLGTFQSSVSSGLATANLNLVAGQARGNYTIAVTYSDSSGSGNFTDDGDVNGTLSIGTSNVATTAGNASAFYSASTQTLTLTATVADVSIPSDKVNEGVVNFTVTDSKGKTVGTAQGNVIGGTVTANNLTLPAGLLPGSYAIAVNYQDSLGNFSDAGDTGATLTIGPAQLVTTAAASNITFSTAAQVVNLNATVSDNSIPADKVSEGIVTFTIKNGSTTIGNAFANVSGGAANATFNWSAGRPAGSYTIAVGYKDSLGNYFDGGDSSSTLTVAAASVTTTANSPLPIIVSSNKQTVTLGATVTNISHSSDKVNEGTVKFTVEDSGGHTVSTAQGSVSGGAASTSYTVPSGQAVGLYSIVASYSDSLGNFSDNGTGDTPGTLTIAPANVITTANNVSATFSSNGQTLKLSAGVANSSVPDNTVGEGTVTFSLIDGGGHTVGTAPGTVSGGAASANFNLPAGQSAGIYTIGVSYKDSSGNDNFTDAGDNSATLTIAPANVTTTANSVSTVYSPKSQKLALSAIVTDTSISGDKVGEGSVTFTITNGSTTIGTAQGAVTGGTANATFNLPAGQALGKYTIGVSYSDSPNNNVLDNGDTSGTLTIAPANVTTTANNVAAVYRPTAQALTLSATVTNTSILGDSVTGGIVTFTIKNSSVIVGTTQASVTGGAASTTFNLPAGQAVGNYTIGVSFSDSTGHYLDSGDTGAALTVAAAQVTTTASNLSAAFSPNARVLSLSATVADASIPGDTVSQGSVNFTVTSGGTTIGTATGLVSGGKATAGFNLPAGQALGSYIINVGYSNSAGNFTDSGDTAGVLTLSPANVTTKANSVSTVYNLNAQTVTLSATVSNASIPGDTVTGGLVTFTILDGSGVIGSVQGAVTSGTASAKAVLSAGFPAGNYTISVSYLDSQGRYLDSGDTSGSLTVQPASVTTTAVSTSTTYSAGGQSLALSAAVTDPGPAINTVSEGIVTFTIKLGSTVVGSVQTAVNNGAANATFNLPAGLAAGNYSIGVSFSDVGGNFADTGDTGGTLSVGTASTTIQLIAAAISPNYTNLTVTEILGAHVSSSTPVTSGTVTFSLSGQTIAANVDGNGNAVITATLPMQTLIGPQTINISYADPAGNLKPSSEAQTAAWQLSNPLIPTTTKFTDKGEVVTIDLFGLLITFTNGVLSEIDFDGIDIVFDYSASNQLIGVTADGMNLLT